MAQHIKRTKGKIMIGSALAILIIGIAVVFMSIQARAHSPPGINDSQLNNRFENNISEEDFKDFYEEMYNLMNKYNFWPSSMMEYRNMGCH